MNTLPADGKYAIAAAFHLRPQLPEVVLVSAHADAFKAARRRAFTGEVVDWARTRPPGSIVLIGGDFNFELDAKDESHLYTDNVKDDSEAYSYALKYFRDLGRDAGYTAVNDRRIDYLFGPPKPCCYGARKSCAARESAKWIIGLCSSRSLFCQIA